MRRVNRAWGQAAAAVLVGVGVALLLGYGGIWPQASPGATSVQLEHTLLVWSGFPAGSHQRPLVLAGSRVLPPSGGFRTQAQRTAFADGAIAPPASYPAFPATADGYGLIPPAAAVALMRSADAAGTRLQVTKVQLGTATFQTDRGPRRLPAWLVRFAGVPSPAMVAATRIYNPPGIATTATPAIRSASVGPDNRTLTITFGAGHNLCGRYTLTVVESRTAVAVAVVGLRGRTDVCAATRHEVTRLARPLDGRVLVDGLTGDPIAVFPFGSSSGEVLHDLTPVRDHRPQVHRSAGPHRDRSGGVTIGDSRGAAVLL